ncbi:MAG: DUF5615 family PIN-like protein [Salinibacter sp.]
MVAFLADESLPGPTVERIQSWGYDIKTAREDGLCGAADPQVFDAARSEDRVLLTADKDFGDIRTFPPSTHAGVIVLRITPRDAAENMSKIHAVLDRLLSEIPEDEYAGTLFTVDRHKYRKRKRP